MSSTEDKTRTIHCIEDREDLPGCYLLAPTSYALAAILFGDTRNDNAVRTFYSIDGVCDFLDDDPVAMCPTTWRDYSAEIRSQV